MEGVEHDPKAAAGSEYFLGRIARIEGRFDSAAEHLSKSIQRMPAFSEPHTEMARLFLDQGKLDEARAELSRALALDPESFQANAQLLALYQRTHDSRKDQQSELLKKLDQERSKRAELMLRSIEIRP
jgi:tetratricopeptide (TPR) repeat protein